MVVHLTAVTAVFIQGKAAEQRQCPRLRWARDPCSCLGASALPVSAVRGPGQGSNNYFEEICDCVWCARVPSCMRVARERERLYPNPSSALLPPRAAAAYLERSKSGVKVCLCAWRLQPAAQGGAPCIRTGAAITVRGAFKALP